MMRGIEMLDFQRQQYDLGVEGLLLLWESHKYFSAKLSQYGDRSSS